MINYPICFLTHKYRFHQPTVLQSKTVKNRFELLPKLNELFLRKNHLAHFTVKLVRIAWCHYIVQQCVEEQTDRSLIIAVEQRGHRYLNSWTLNKVGSYFLNLLENYKSVKFGLKQFQPSSMSQQLQNLNYLQCCAIENQPDPLYETKVVL